MEVEQTNVVNQDCFQTASVNIISPRGAVVKADRKRIAASIQITSASKARGPIVKAAIRKLKQNVRFDISIDYNSTKVISKGGNMYVVVLGYFKKILSEFKP